MSQENVEIVRAFYRDVDQALQTRWNDPEMPFGQSTEAEALLQRVHDDVVWKPPFRTPGSDYRGHDGVQRALAEWQEVADDWRLVIEEMGGADSGRVFVVFAVSARGKGSGVPIEQRVYTAVTVDEGKIRLIEDFGDRTEALEAAGLRE
jgi:ketosteroid isomerase-like protein